MNHLAHFLLAPADAQSQLGTLLADFHRGPIASSLPAQVARAIALHRRIDAATDAEDAVRRLKRAFAPGLRRFAGLALDLYFDHCLCRHWHRFSKVPLDVFVQRTHSALDAGLAACFVPDRMRIFAAAMRDQDWLRSYAAFGGVEAALGRLEHAFRRRFEREVSLRPLAGELVRLQPAADATFACVFPSLVRLSHAHAASPPAASPAGPVHDLSSPRLQET
jgi:acyl carrier protein phosphodiesterase